MSVAGADVVVVRMPDGAFCALAETCAHLGGPLAEGEVSERMITCPWHGSRYALVDGAVLDGPSAFAQPPFETRVADSVVELRRRQ